MCDFDGQARVNGKPGSRWTDKETGREGMVLYCMRLYDVFHHTVLCQALNSPSRARRGEHVFRRFWNQDDHPTGRLYSDSKADNDENDRPL